MYDAGQIAAYRISIHALREEGDFALVNVAVKQLQISIHALREEGDQHSLATVIHIRISIHALREEGDPSSVPFGPRSWLFLSTPSARRATAMLWGMISRVTKFLSTPSARRATHRGRSVRPGIRISIHALREEGDRCQQR